MLRTDQGIWWRIEPGSGQGLNWMFELPQSGNSGPNIGAS